MVLLGCDDQGANTLNLALDLLFLVLSRRRVVPYIHGLTPCGLQSLGQLIQPVRLGDISYMHCITSLFIHGGLYSWALSRLWASVYYNLIITRHVVYSSGFL